MIITLVWCGCLFLGVYLWKQAENFRVDAAPVGSMMIGTAIGLWISSVFIFGVQVGMLIS